MKNQKKLFLILFVIVISLTLIIILLNKGKEIAIKNNYSTEEIFNKLNYNNKKLKGIKIKFSDTWVNVIKGDAGFRDNTDDTVLFHNLITKKIKIVNPSVTIIYTPSEGFIKRYKKNNGDYRYNHIINWLGAVYKEIILLPLQLQDLKRYGKVKVIKMKKKGYYLVEISTKEKGLNITGIVNMYYGVFEVINIEQSKILVDKKNGNIYYPYTISAVLKNIKNFDDIYFPTKVEVTYVSKNEKYAFITHIKDIEFNNKLRDKFFTLKREEVIWYQDPFWLKGNSIVLIKGIGEKKINQYGGIDIINKNFYLIIKNIENNKERYLKHIIFVKDVTNKTGFIFTGDYNEKYNLIAYSISASLNNQNENLKRIEGLYILDIKTKKYRKISDRGFMPLWSNNEEMLLWNVPSKDERGINKICLYNYKKDKKSLIIDNGFHYGWGKNDETIIFEKGWWIFGKGYYIPYNLTGKDIRGGIYSYNLKKKITTIISRRGFNPQISLKKDKIIFSDRKERSGIYLYNIEKKNIKKIISLKNSPRIYSSYWYASNSILYIKDDYYQQSERGLYRYYINNNSEILLSPKIQYRGVYTVYLNLSPEKNYLLYKFYKHPDWNILQWGIYNLNSGEIITYK